MSTDPSKTSGQVNSTLGTMQEAAGNAIGSKEMASNGQQRHAQGEAETTQAKAQGYVEGAKETFIGYKDSVLGAITGDKTQQAEGNVRKEAGETQKQMNQ